MTMTAISFKQRQVKPQRCNYQPWGMEIYSQPWDSKSRSAKTIPMIYWERRLARRFDYMIRRTSSITEETEQSLLCETGQRKQKIYFHISKSSKKLKDRRKEQKAKWLAPQGWLWPKIITWLSAGRLLISCSPAVKWDIWLLKYSSSEHKLTLMWSFIGKTDMVYASSIHLFDNAWLPCKLPCKGMHSAELKFGLLCEADIIFVFALFRVVMNKRLLLRQ